MISEKSAFIIGPVRNMTEEEKRVIGGYVSKLESEGYKVHYPPRDTNQDDPIGTNIIAENREAIRNADEIHVYWNGKSKGSLFDIGMAYTLDKPIVLINRGDIKKTPHKSFENVLLELDSQYRAKIAV